MPVPTPALTSTGDGLASAANLAWQLTTRLGEAQILLPAMLAAVMWLLLAARSWRVAVWWLVGTGITASLTTVTKVAFFGFEVGYSPWDYTGISGHAMFAGAILPMLTGLMAGGARARWRLAAIAAGYLLAALVAYSRLPVRAHSPVETFAGLALGSLASALALTRWQLPEARPPGWLGVGLLLWMLSLPLGAPPSSTDGWVRKLAMAVSGRPAPYERWQMHGGHQQQVGSRHAAVSDVKEARHPSVSM